MQRVAFNAHPKGVYVCVYFLELKKNISKDRSIYSFSYSTGLLVYFVGLGAVLVTDALAAMGLSDGVHALGPHTVEVKDGAARLTGQTTLAGR